MDALTTAAASGMKARMESLEMLANNIANQSSPGYKADREFYSLYIAPEALASLNADVVPIPPTVPLIERHRTDFAQGVLNETGNPLHLGLGGKGFFTVAGPSGPLYTRNGSFRLSNKGELETQEGFAVLSQAGQPIRLNPAQQVDITRTGAVRQGGAVVAQLGLVDFRQPEALSKHSGTYFQLNDPALQPIQVPDAVVHQGKLEAANFSPAESAVRLVGVMRQFEMLQKAIQIGSEMGRRSEEVARVGS